MSAPVDVRRNLRMVLQHVLICGPDDAVQRAIQETDDAVAELIEADKEYDAARKPVVGILHSHERDKWLARMEAAEARRAAALAALTTEGASA